MQLQLIGSINAANGVQKIRFTQDIMASHLFVRAVALQEGAVPTTEADWGNFKISNKDGQIVNASGTLLRALANVLKGNPIFTPGTVDASAIEYYLPLFRRLPGETNVDFFQKDDNFVFEWEPGAGLNAKLEAGSFLMELHALPALGVKNYDLKILRQTRPVNANQPDTIVVDEENIAMLFVSDAQALPETLASGGLQGGRIGVKVGPMSSYATVQDAIASTQAFMRLEGSADFTTMACIFDASIVSEGFGGNLFNGAKVEVLNGSSPATVSLLSVSKRMRNRPRQVSRDIVRQELSGIEAQARRDGHSSKLAVLADAGLSGK